MQLRDLRTLFIVFALAWAIADLFGQVSIFGSPLLIENQFCYRYLGCDAGFFGYDAFVHFLAGVTEVLAILYLLHLPRTQPMLMRRRLWNVATLVAIVVCLAFAWEVIEFASDHIRIYVLHENVFEPNRLAQATSDDTVGDMFFATLGALATCLLIAAWRPQWLSRQQGEPLHA